MRLTKWGRLLHGAVALAFLAAAAGSWARAAWLGVGLELLAAALFAYPALTGRSPLAAATHVPGWLGTVEAPRDRAGPRDAD